jgi:hypothetical protein
MHPCFTGGTQSVSVVALQRGKFGYKTCTKNHTSFNFSFDELAKSTEYPHSHEIKNDAPEDTHLM